MLLLFFIFLVGPQGAGTRQDGRHNGMDQTHEPDQSTGRGTGDPGDYLQLSLFPTEEEQFGEIRKAAAALEQPAAFLISDEVVDHILRTGSGQKNTLFHITARLIEGLDNEEMQSFLKDEYGMPALSKKYHNQSAFPYFFIFTSQMIKSGISFIAVSTPSCPLVAINKLYSLPKSTFRYRRISL